MNEHDLRDSGIVYIPRLRAKLAYSCLVFGLLGCLFEHDFSAFVLSSDFRSGLRAKIVLCLVFGLLGFSFDMKRAMRECATAMVQIAARALSRFCHLEVLSR